MELQTVLSIVGSLVGIAILLRSLWNYLRLPVLSRIPVNAHIRLPKLSVIITARNEETGFEQALSSLVATDYPSIEFIVINDRSTDGTGAILDRMASHFPQITPIHIASLPEGWLGKTHALHRGSQKASGDWLLFTDADIHFHQDALKRALTWAVSQELDHFTLIPKMKAGDWLSQTAIASFLLAAMAGFRIGRNGVLEGSSYAGVGAFNLVRASVFQTSLGFEWLRMEVIDDIGLGLLMKQENSRSGIGLAPNMLALTWYPSFSAMLKGFEKNAYAALGHYRWWIALLKIAIIFWLFASPWLALIEDATFARALGSGVLISGAIGAVMIHKRVGLPMIYALFHPLGILLMFVLGLNSMIRTHCQRGIRWRDTFYDLTTLRKHQRVKL